MLKKLARTLGLATLLLSASTQALPIVQADAFSAGDNKAALETSTGLVWMDFGVNSHRTFSDVVSSLDTDYAGWRLPTIAEVDHLWTSLFGHLAGWHRWSPDFGMFTLRENNEFGVPVSVYDDYLNSILDVFGISEEGTAEVTWYEGGILVNRTIYDYRASAAVFSDSGQNGFFNLLVPINSTLGPHAIIAYGEGYWKSDISSAQGTLLVKDSVAVPEPASGLLAVLAIFILTVRRLSFRR